MRSRRPMVLVRALRMRTILTRRCITSRLSTRRDPSVYMCRRMASRRMRRGARVLLAFRGRRP